MSSLACSPSCAFCVTRNSTTSRMDIAQSRTKSDASYFWCVHPSHTASHSCVGTSRRLRISEPGRTNQHKRTEVLRGMTRACTRHEKAMKQYTRMRSITTLLIESLPQHQLSYPLGGSIRTSGLTVVDRVDFGCTAPKSDIS